MRPLRSFSSEVPKAASAALLLLAAYVLLAVGKSALYPWFRAAHEADHVASGGALQQVSEPFLLFIGLLLVWGKYSHTLSPPWLLRQCSWQNGGGEHSRSIWQRCEGTLGDWCGSYYLQPPQLVKVRSCAML